MKGALADWGDSARFFLKDTQMIYARFLYKCNTLVGLQIQGLTFVEAVTNLIAAELGIDFLCVPQHHICNIVVAFDSLAEVVENLFCFVAGKVAAVKLVNFVARLLAVVAKRVYCKMADLVAYYY